MDDEESLPPLGPWVVNAGRVVNALVCSFKRAVERALLDSRHQSSLAPNSIASCASDYRMGRLDSDELMYACNPIILLEGLEMVSKLNVDLRADNFYVHLRKKEYADLFKIVPLDGALGEARFAYDALCMN